MVTGVGGVPPAGQQFNNISSLRSERSDDLNNLTIRLMKVALVHDYLTEYGGAERVLEALHELWPRAPVFTSICDNTSALHSAEVFDEKWDIRPSPMQKFPFVRWLSKQYTFFYPLVFEHFDLREYDVVISDGTIWSKGVLTTPEQLHIHYCHTPPRWLYGYLGETDRRRLWYLQSILKPLDNWLRIWDFESAQRPDFIVANSKTVGERVRKFWRREAEVIYPPVGRFGITQNNSAHRNVGVSERQGVRDASVPEFRRSGSLEHRRTEFSEFSDLPSYSEFSGNSYFLVVSRLSAYKNVHLAIEACNKLNLPLVIVGTGREEERLKALAGKNVTFMNFVEDKELSKLYKHCKALIFPVSDEDFGIVPVEAMGFGKPVVTLRSGGVTETVVEGKTGVFFEEPTVASLVKTIQQFNHLTIRPEDCLEQAQKFSKERFQKEIKDFVEEKWRDKVSENKSVTQ